MVAALLMGYILPLQWDQQNVAYADAPVNVTPVIKY